LHSYWSIAFDCWNSNSKFEFYCLSLFKISKSYFLPYPSFPLSGPAARASAVAAHSAIGTFSFPSPRPSPASRAAQPAHRRQPALPPAPVLLWLTAGAQLSSPTWAYPGRTRPRVRPAAAARAAWLPWPARLGGPPGYLKPHCTPLNLPTRAVAAAFVHTTSRRNPNPSFPPLTLIPRRRRFLVVVKQSRSRTSW
jgi:hypothetical protein